MHSRNPFILMLLASLLLAPVSDLEGARKDKKKKEQAQEQTQKVGDDPYAEYVWPQPPDEPRFRLTSIHTGRADTEGSSRLKKMLIGASPPSQYDKLRKPHAVAFDSQGRILVTDWGNAALIRFDREGARMDVFGTQGSVRLKQPLGLTVTSDDVAYIADPGLKQVVAFDAEGKLRSVYGRQGELVNPTDAAVSPDGKRLLVADSKAHQIVVFDRASGDRLSSFGTRGEGEGEFNFPTALTFGPEGNLFVVDQINARVQVFDSEFVYLDEFGGLGIGFGLFTRPKGIAVDADGLIYVVDNAFNNVQLFDVDFALLTFVGEGGRSPGRFHGASGVAVRGDELAVVEQLGRRLQVFRFLEFRGK